MSARNEMSRTQGMVRVACGIIGVMAISLQGCASAPHSGRGFERKVQTVADEEFAAGANRPPTAKTLYALARLMEAQGRYAEYEIVLARTVQRFPRFGPAYLDWANLKVRQGQLDDAIAIVEQGVNFSSDDSILLNNLGMCRLMNGDYAGALEAFERAVALKPDDRRYTCNTAVALGMLGRYEDCLLTYEQVMDTAWAHYNLAVICEARNDVERAGEEYAAARELNRFIKRRKSFGSELSTMVDTSD